MRTISRRTCRAQNFEWTKFCRVILLAAMFGGMVAASEPDQVERRAQIESALERATRFLIDQQQPDGTWRSMTYGLLKDETSLTSLVMWSLADSPLSRSAREKGLAAMASWVDSDGGSADVRLQPQYPAYVAGMSLCILARSPSGGNNRQILTWQNLLVAHQLNESNSWTPLDDRYGGWGYSHARPVKPESGGRLSPLSEPNLSATVFALEGLQASSLSADAKSEIRAKALRFVVRCQNWREHSSLSDMDFDDGGFHFVLDDEIRNKPGIAGVDSTGQIRFRSYGSATADGLRALRLCGLKPDHPRVIAARNWLIRASDSNVHPGNYPPERMHLRPALNFYYACSLMNSMQMIYNTSDQKDDLKFITPIAQEILRQQRDDGSWSNPAVDVREDDPLIATSFAIKTLRISLNQIQQNSD